MERVNDEQYRVANNITPQNVSADLKGSQFSRFRCEPESLPVVVEHTNAAAAVRKQAVTIVSFFPASAG